MFKNDTWPSGRASRKLEVFAFQIETAVTVSGCIHVGNWQVSRLADAYRAATAQCHTKESALSGRQSEPCKAALRLLTCHRVQCIADVCKSACVPRRVVKAPKHCESSSPARQRLVWVDPTVKLSCTSTAKSRWAAAFAHTLLGIAHSSVRGALFSGRE